MSPTSVVEIKGLLRWRREANGKTDRPLHLSRPLRLKLQPADSDHFREDDPSLSAEREKDDASLRAKNVRRLAPFPLTHSVSSSSVEWVNSHTSRARARSAR